MIGTEFPIKYNGTVWKNDNPGGQRLRNNFDLSPKPLPSNKSNEIDKREPPSHPPNNSRILLGFSRMDTGPVQCIALKVLNSSGK